VTRPIHHSSFIIHHLPLLGVALALICATAPAPAQSYPAGPVKVIVPFPPGGGVDGMARILTHKLAESLGKNLPVENRGGANGNIGTGLAAKAPKDGYTLLFTGAGFVTNPSLYAQTGYDAVKDFDPVSLVSLAPNVLVAHPSLPVRSVKELVALAKARPGQVLFAGSGSGSTPHLAGELFNTLAKVRMVHVPYRGSGPAIVGLLSGEASIMFLPATNAVNLTKSGRVRAIAVTTRERVPALPELPTVAEAGLKGYESNQWYGVLAPAGTPQDVLELLNSHIAKIMQAEDMKQRLAASGVLPVGGTREQFAAHIRIELEKWARVVKASGARVD
jgi:tripartite-type tricarboxylate transporter receptor subunit TctC